MHNSRREFIQKTLFASGVAGISIPDVAGNIFSKFDDDRLVLLGTQGGPFIRSYSQIPSANLIVFKNIPIVIDTGYGASFKLKEAGINLAGLKYIFISHLHSDHCLDLGPLLYNAWIAGLTEAINVYGPPGISAMLSAYWESNSFDINTRVKDEKRPDIRQLVISHEIAEGVLLKTGDIEIAAIKNLHPPIEQSFSFRCRLGAKLVVFSGDTSFFPKLAEFALGADYLVHEVMYGPAVPGMVKRRNPQDPEKLKASILSHHTLAEDVGRIATTAKVKNLVLTHFVPPDDKSLTDEIWLKAVKATYNGNVVIGRDMLQFAL